MLLHTQARIFSTVYLCSTATIRKKKNRKLFMVRQVIDIFKTNFVENSVIVLSHNSSTILFYVLVFVTILFLYVVRRCICFACFVLFVIFMRSVIYAKCYGSRSSWDLFTFVLLLSLTLPLSFNKCHINLFFRFVWNFVFHHSISLSLLCYVYVYCEYAWIVGLSLFWPAYGWQGGGLWI